jgi:hypothetical protein
VHDIADLELRGVPSMFVASSEFATAVISQSGAIGFPDVARVFVEHPIQDRTDAEMVAIADGAFPQILAAICASN